jgi:Polyketide cyclase / dehydrase and lipid transport.
MDNIVIINRPIQEVFAFVTDHANDKQWKPFVVESRQVSAGPINVGTMFEVTVVSWNRHIPGHVEVLEYEPYRWYAYKSHSQPLPFIASLSFTPTPSGTAIRGDVKFQARGAWRWLTPLLLIIIRSQSKQTFARLKKVMDGADSQRAPASQIKV